MILQTAQIIWSGKHLDNDLVIFIMPDQKTIGYIYTTPDFILDGNVVREELINIDKLVEVLIVSIETQYLSAVVQQRINTHAILH